MRRRSRLIILGVFAALLTVPIGFALAGSASGPDPDPSTDPGRAYQDLQQAISSGNSASEQKAADAVRSEIVSRMSPEERASALNASDQTSVPDGTDLYIAPNAAPTAQAVDRCKAQLAADDGRIAGDELCKFVVLYSEGKLTAGSYTAAQAASILGQ